MKVHSCLFISIITIVIVIIIIYNFMILYRLELGEAASGSLSPCRAEDDHATTSITHEVYIDVNNS